MATFTPQHLQCTHNDFVCFIFILFMTTFYKLMQLITEQQLQFLSHCACIRILYALLYVTSSFGRYEGTTTRLGK
jgi:hypothetical protein